MLLVIAPTDGGVLKIFLTTRGASRKIAYERGHIIRSHHLGGILPLLIKFCREHKISFSDLDGIAVVPSAGSFTTTRLVVSLANIIGWIYDLRIVSLRSVDKFDFKIASLKSKSGFRGFVKPVYSGAPNITHAPIPSPRRGGAGLIMKKY